MFEKNIILKGVAEGDTAKAVHGHAGRVRYIEKGNEKMATDYRSVHAKCPFYFTEDNLLISCEGVTGSSKLRLTFNRTAPKERYRLHYCDESFETCRVYQMLMGKYE